ncbi:MAG TPA: hypothetical protein VFD49_20795 [Candidatus Dormibacteraeota bacterium]|nr:hypothetical protein [Candidatus Dormibacteraeota bacterium]
MHELYERDRPVLLDAPYEPPYDAWQHVELRSWRAVTDPRLNHRLRAEQRIAVELAGERWRPAPKHLAELQQLRRMRIDFDDAKIRLASALLTSSTAVVLQRTDYSAFLVTNKLGIVDVMGYGERPLVRAEAVVLRGGVIPNLRRSGCSNHLGVDVLAVVDDGRIVFTRQTAANQLSQKLLVSSGSGSMDWSDLRRGDDLVTLVKRAMRREMLEELGIPDRERPGLEQLRVLGYARPTHLGGKPQFFGAARLHRATTSIKGIEKRYAFDHVTLDYSPAGGVRDLERAIERFESRLHPSARSRFISTSGCGWTGCAAIPGRTAGCTAERTRRTGPTRSRARGRPRRLGLSPRPSAAARRPGWWPGPRAAR